MNLTLSRFLEALRQSEMQISPAEAIDAYRTVALVGPGERQFLLDALTVTLAKSVTDETRLAETFDAFFQPHLADPSVGSAESSDDDADGDATGEPGDTTDGSGLPGDPSALGDVGEAEDFAQMLMSGDQAGLTAALQGAAREVGLERMWLFTQKNQFTRRMLESLGLRDLERAMAEADRAGDDGRGADLVATRTAMFDAARQFVEREFELFARDTARRLADERLLDARMASVDARDRKRMVALVRRLAKRLASLYSTRQRRVQRGKLDVRRTMRRNHRNDDLLFDITWRVKRVDRPKIMVVCDTSRSVAAVTQFLMLFVYGLSEVLRDVRSFVLCSNLVETTELFRGRRLEDAVDDALEAAVLGSTDYGRGLVDFCELALDRIDRRTTVLFLGDARSNFTDPRTDLLATIHARARCVVWLNNEPRSFWGTGDSEMLRYLPHVDIAKTVSSLSDLDRAIHLMMTRAKR